MPTQAQVRAAFWQSFPQFKRESVPAGRSSSGALLRRAKRQNEYRADVRMAFVDYVDSLEKGGTITRQLAENVTL